MNDFWVHNINPVMFSIWRLDVRWYAFMFMLSFLIGYLFIIKNMKKMNVDISRDKYESFVFTLMISILIGGRLGYTFFYDFSYTILNPLSIFAVWRGGMSFHGGAIGCIVAGLLFSRKNKYNFYSLADPAMPIVAIGIGLVRIGNFINAELFGTETTVPWAVIFRGHPNHPFFPVDPYMLPRHPSQLYQAFVEGFILAVILQIMLFKVKTKGIVFWSFIGLYGIGRFFIEYFRTPDLHLSIYTDGLLFSTLPISMGQLFSIIMVTLASIGFYFVLRKK